MFAAGNLLAGVAQARRTSTICSCKADRTKASNQVRNFYENASGDAEKNLNAYSVVLHEEWPASGVCRYSNFIHFRFPKKIQPLFKTLNKTNMVGAFIVTLLLLFIRCFTLTEMDAKAITTKKTCPNNFRFHVSFNQSTRYLCPVHKMTVYGPPILAMPDVQASLDNNQTSFMYSKYLVALS